MPGDLIIRPLVADPQFRVGDDGKRAEQSGRVDRRGILVEPGRGKINPHAGIPAETGGGRRN